MGKEFLEITSLDALIKVAEEAKVVIRMDPIIIIPLYGLTFFLDLRKMNEGEVKEIFIKLRDKIVLVNRIVMEDSLSDLIKKVV
ncbi:MAG: hypothetical protein N3F64_01070 [Nitrososphaeria archaeon]|nr:hypothetical protein [Nitrososphaeria archaeon]